MVNNKLYYDTGKESTLDGRCGVMDGKIISTVDGSEIPTKMINLTLEQGLNINMVQMIP